MKLIWGSVAVGALEVGPALQVMSSLAQGEGAVYRAPEIALAQFGDVRTRFSDVSGDAPEPRYRVVAAARFDERGALCSALGLPPSVGDEQLIIAAYRRWSEACPQHLLGDFAFALWDAETRRLFCARDQLGIMPFYYAQQGSSFYFASDIEGVLACPGIAPKLDLRYVKSYLLHELFVNPHHSFFEAIKKLPAGHTLSFAAGRVTLACYWHPADVPELRLANDAAYYEQLRALLEEAVRCRLAADPPAAAHLSSGLDSSTVTVLAARLSATPLTTFSWSQPGDLSALELTYDERSEIEALRVAEGLNVAYTALSARDILDTLTDITRVPQVHQATENVVLAKARELGVRSLLSGWGGDECVSYYGRAYLSEVLLRGRFPELLRQLHGWSQRSGRRVWYRGLKRAGGLLVPEPLRLAYSRFWSDPLALPRCLSPDFRASLDGVEAYPWHDYLLKSTVKADQAALLTRGQISQRTEAWAAQSARYGLSYTYPLLDRRVVEFALGAPSRLYFHHGQTRQLFRQATAGILPDAIRLKTLKQDPALEEPHYALLDGLLRSRQLHGAVEARTGDLKQSGMLDLPSTLAGLQTDSLTAFLEHPSGIARALWLTSISPETVW